MNDLIRRQAAIDALGYCQTYLFDSRDDDKKISLEDAEYAIEQLPPVQPERPTGHWIIYVISPFDGEDVKCSECGMRSCAPYWDYCPGCGAKMEGVENERSY